MDKLYIVVRNDLSPGLQVAQSCHALRQFTADYPQLDATWHSGTNNVVCLQVADKHQLLALAEDATRAGVACSTYREPDVHDEPTAIALAADAKRLVRGLDLALAA